MKQTHILYLKKGLAVAFLFQEKNVNITWSRRLRQNDYPLLEEHYVPWRNKLLAEWADETKVKFADLPLIELVTRKSRKYDE